VSAAGTYTLVVTGANGCTSQASAEVTLDDELPGASAQGGVLNCNTASVQLIGGGNGTFAWSGPNGFNSTEQSPTVSAAGTYTLVVTGANGCTSQASAEVTLDDELPGASAQGGVLNCNTASVQLIGNGNGTYAWSGPNNFVSTEQNPTVSAAGTYTLVVTGANGCTSQASAEVTLDDVLPGASAQGGVLDCNTASVQLIGGGNGTFAWSGPNGFNSTEQNPTVSAAGTYTLVVTGANGCTSQASAEVTLDDVLPGASAQGGVLNCNTASVQLIGGGNGTYAWSGPNGFNSTEQSPTVSAAGTYTLVVTGANGCTSQASAEVTLDDVLPGANAQGGVLNCNTASVQLIGGGNGTFAWSGPNGFNSTEQNPTVSAAGTYTLVVTGANGCTSQASAEVTLDDVLPGASAQGGVLNCNTASVQLIGGGNGTYAWSGPNGFNSTEQSPTVSAAGTYTLVVTGANGCTSQASAEVTLDDVLPGASAQGGVLNCNTASVQLIGGGNGTYAWSGPNGFNSTEQSPTVSAAGTYTLVVTGANGCTSQASAEVTLDDVLPGANAQGGVLNCNTASVQLIGGGNGTFAWSGPNGFNSTEQSPTVSAAGTYTLVVTGANGCTSQASAEVTLDDVLPGAKRTRRSAQLQHRQRSADRWWQRNLRLERTQRIQQHRAKPNGKRCRYLHPRGHRCQRMHQPGFC
jgi:large repetitive protein